jgi:hypothetical protein
MIRIELSSDSIATVSSASSIAVHCGSPVISLARKLVALGIDPDTSLQAYRGQVHCLTVKSIGLAAALEAEGARFKIRAAPQLGLASHSPAAGQQVSSKPRTAITAPSSLIA